MKVAIIGAQRVRVQKVVTLLRSNAEIASNVEIDYLPCVASFGSYENEAGQTIRYLEKLMYVSEKGFQGLAPIFDEVDEKKETEKDDDLPRIAVVAIGCGIEEEDDVKQIKTFFATLDPRMADAMYGVIRPNPEYSTMKEESQAYRMMDEESKAKVTRDQTLGPGKMAKFVSELVCNVQSQESQHLVDECANGELEETIHELKEKEEVLIKQPREIDPNKDRFACRICRTVLFGHDDLQNPPHVPQLHSFHKKRNKKGYGENVVCASYFLADCLDWMGPNAGNEVEGKFSCPSCSAKLGQWKWAGAQCSCGTWVVPAIQIPRSKVDVLEPSTNQQPAGIVVSPLIVHSQLGILDPEH